MSAIEKTWNPVIGCRRVTEGCRHCYAETMAGRLVHMGGSAGERYQQVVKLDEAGQPRGRWNGRAVEVPEALDKPRGWAKPQRVFVNSMSDLFHADVSDEYIARVFEVMAATPRHTYQVLTKRPERARAWCAWFVEQRHLRNRIEGCATVTDILRASMGRWPLPNVWLGVSVEDQDTADERIPALLTCPAAVRFVSYEPALGPVDFTSIRYGDYLLNTLSGRYRAPADESDGLPFKLGMADLLGRLDWIIVGGESGPGARPFDLRWARSTVEACRCVGVPVFVKQLGARPVTGFYDQATRDHYEDDLGRTWPDPIGWTSADRHQPLADARVALKLRSRKGGDPAEWPEDIRVRQYPAAATSEANQ